MLTVDFSEIKKFTPAPQGTHRGVCVDVTYDGLKRGKYGPYKSFSTAWELDEEMPDGRRFTVFQSYNLKRLKEMLEEWRGQPIPEEKFKAFDLESILGKSAMLSVSHSPNPRGGVYCNIDKVMKLHKSMEPLAPTGKFVRRKDRPDYRPPVDEIATEPAYEREPGLDDDEDPFDAAFS